VHVTRQPCCDFSARARGATAGVCIISSIGFVLSGRRPTPPPIHARARAHTGTALFCMWIIRRPLSLSRRTCPQTSIFRIFPLSLARLIPASSPLPVAFFASPRCGRSGMASHRRNRYRPSIYNFFLDVARPFARAGGGEFSAKGASPRAIPAR
jgi:hypothetical protein